MILLSTTDGRSVVVGIVKMILNVPSYYDVVIFIYSYVWKERFPSDFHISLPRTQMAFTRPDGAAVDTQLIWKLFI